MHDHRIDAGLFQHHNVAGESAGALLVTHGVAAIFDQNDFIIIALHMGQGLTENPADLEIVVGHDSPLL